jgi:DNA-directed RNA polymerase specialized sigma24 family protein
LVRALAGLAGDRERAEDALQDALADASKGGVIERIERADAWLYAVAVRHLRRSRLRAAVESAATLLRGGSTPPPSTDRVAALELLGELSARQREIVIARFYLDLTYSEIAADFGISVGTASATVTQALKKIRQRLAANPEELKAWKTGS